jgi:competence ComEA-like helix-hairpin-helix protein
VEKQASRNSNLPYHATGAAACRLAALGLLAIAAAFSWHARLEGRGHAQDDPSKATFQRVCSNCHPIERVLTAPRRARAQWEETIQTMISTRGAKVADEEFDVIVSFLTRARGRVNVNAAAADALAEVLEIDDAVAQAIVTFRKEHGPFQDIESLAKVPGLDRDTLEKKRDAVAF